MRERLARLSALATALALAACAHDGPPRQVEAPVPPVDLAERPDPEAEGRMDRAAFSEVMAAHMPEAVDCFERHALPDPRSGRVTVRFVVAPDGRVASAEAVDSTLASPELDRCLVEAVGSWVFPAPAGGPVTLTYPFFFDSPGL